MNKKYNIDKYIQTPIEFTDMQNMLSPYFKSQKLRLVLKEDFNNVSLEAMFSDEYAPFVVYFIENQNSNVGHYTLLTWRDQKTIELFDPAGITGEIIENEHPEFYKFCADYDLCIYFNTTPIQSKNSQTCSRHCIYRAMLCNIGIEDFMKFYPERKDLTPDEFISCVIRYPK